MILNFHDGPAGEAETDTDDETAVVLIVEGWRRDEIPLHMARDELDWRENQ